IGDRAAAILVAHGGHDPAAMALAAGHVPIPDLPTDYGGPLAGLAAAVDWCARQTRPAEYLLLAAVATPFLPADFLSRALAAIAPGATAVTARYAGQDYPTDSLWRLSAVGALPDAVRAGTAPRS